MKIEVKKWNQMVDVLVREIKEDITYEKLDRCEAYDYALQSINDYIDYNDSDVVISYIADNGIGSVEVFEEIYQELIDEVMDNIFEYLLKGEKC